MTIDWPRTYAPSAVRQAAEWFGRTRDRVPTPASLPAPLAPYVTAFAAMVMAVVLRAIADPWLGEKLPYVTLFGAVAIATRTGGRRAAGLASLAGLLATEYFFVAPRWAFRMDGPALIGMALYAATCAAIVAVIGAPAPVDAKDVVADGEVAALQHSARSLREADRRKDEFLAVLAHELRNPLAPIRVGVEVLRQRAGDPHAVDDVRGVIERQVAHLVRLVDDLLDVSRITRGQWPLRRQVADLGDVLRTAIESTRPSIDAAGLRFTVSLPATPLRVTGDPVRLAQVVGNLLANAAKYTEPGGHVWLTAALEGERIVVAVRDTGIGLTAEQCASVFDMFSQTARGRERAQGGLGIGLALVQEIVTRHGGRVDVRSDGPGCGSTFTVSLPSSDDAVPAAVAAVDPVAAPAGRPWRVLLVDDVQDAADSLATMLTLMGHETRTAYDGRAAVEVAEAFRPDLMVLDIGLPIFDGFEVARRVRQAPWGRHAVLVALTGWAQDGARRHGLEAGFDHYWTKPVEPQAIEALLSSTPRT